MTRDWLDAGDHGIRIGLEYGSIVDSATRGAITADTVNAEVSNLEVWIDCSDWPFTDNVNHLTVSGSAVTDDSWSNLTAGTSSSKKLKELNPQSNPLEFGNPVTRACTVSLSGIEAAGETLNGTHNFPFPARPYHIPASPVVGISANTITCSGNQNATAVDRYWALTDWYLETNGVRAALWLDAPGYTNLVNYTAAANSMYRGVVYAQNDAGVSPGAFSPYFYGAMSAPGTPTVSRGLNSTTVNVAWAAGAAPVYTRTYVVERSLNGGGWTQVAVTNGLAFADTVAVGSVAYYRVIAYAPGSVANSAWSGTSAASPTGKQWTVPNPPAVTFSRTGPTTAAAAITGNQNNPAVDKYWEFIDWQYSVNDGAFGGGGALAGSAASIPMTGLSQDAKYIVRVKSRNSEGGSSAWVASNAVYTTPDTPVAFAAARASAGSTTVNFTWTNNAGYPGRFSIEQSLDNGLNWSQVVTTTTVGSASTTQSISQAALYRLRVFTPGDTDFSDYTPAVAVGVAFVSDRTKMKLGTSTIDYIYVGTQRVRRVYRGTTVVWEDGDA